MKNILFLFVSCMITFGCRNGIKVANELVKLTDGDFGKEILINSKKLDYCSDKLIDPDKIYSIDEYLLVIDLKSENSISVIDTKKEKYLGTFGKRGKGSGEITDAYSISNINDRSFMVYDVEGQRIFGFDIDSLISNKNSLFEKKLKISGMPENFTKKGEELYYTKQIDPTKRVFKKRIDKADSPEELGIGLLPRIAKESHSDITNAQLCYTTFKAKKNMFVFAYDLVPLIEIYDMENDKWKSIVSPTEFTPEYAIPNDPYFAYTRNTLIAYKDIALSDQYIYALYSGKSYLSAPRTLRNEAKEIFVFDFDGKPIKRFKLDKNLVNISIVGDILYGISLDDIKPEIVQFELNI